MNQAIVIRRLAITVILLVLASVLFFQGASTYQGNYWEVVRAIYFSGAAIVFAIAIIPWMTRE
jgi:hypothetical protein